MGNLDTILIGASLVINAATLSVLAYNMYHLNKSTVDKTPVPSAGGISYFNLHRAFEK